MTLYLMLFIGLGVYCMWFKGTDFTRPLPCKPPIVAGSRWSTVPHVKFGSRGLPICIYLMFLPPSLSELFFSFQLRINNRLGLSRLVVVDGLGNETRLGSKWILGPPNQSSNTDRYKHNQKSSPWHVCMPQSTSDESQANIAAPDNEETTTHIDTPFREPANETEQEASISCTRYLLRLKFPL